MPPKRKRVPKKKKEEESEVLTKRSFVELAKISKHLICSICSEVFNNPVMPPCQHTFCQVCITGWTKS